VQSTWSWIPACVLSLALCACGAAPSADAELSDFLYVWAGDADTADPDFLAVFDVRPGSSRYGEVVATVPVDGRANVPHHTEYDLTAQTLFANGWNSGRTFVFDVSQPDAPHLSTTFAGVAGYAYPHSYARLPNGNVLATFQSVEGAYTPPGGLVELDERGRMVRAVSGASPDIELADTWPYSLLVLPDLDRVVTTNTRMGTVAEWLGEAESSAEPGAAAGTESNGHGAATHGAATDGAAHGHGAATHGAATHGHAIGRNSRPTHVQVWRLSDLSLLATLQLPPQAGGHHEDPAEPRRLANGDVLVNTFTCGVYRITDVAGARPGIEPVLHSPFEGEGWCAVPVVIGNWWIQPSATEDAIVAYDLSDPTRPREASRITLAAPFRAPHWLAAEPSGRRIVVTADYPDTWIMLLDFDTATGTLSIDERFREAGAERPGIPFDRASWPHGATGPAAPHGAVFSIGRATRVATDPG
jgi:hypothetical protein